MDRLFLDANVLFSTAYGSPRIGSLWQRAAEGGCRLLASQYVIEEARRNLDETQQQRLGQLLRPIEEVADFPTARPCPIDLPDKDIPVLWAAVAAKASHLLSGDVRHFGPYFGQVVQGVRIMRPAAYLKPDLT